MSPKLSQIFLVETLSELKTISGQRSKQKTWNFHSEYTRVFQSGRGNTISILFSSDLRIKKKKILKMQILDFRKKWLEFIRQSTSQERTPKKTLTNFAGESHWLSCWIYKDFLVKAQKKKNNKYAQYKIELDFIKVKKFSSPKDT